MFTIKNGLSKNNFTKFRIKRIVLLFQLSILVALNTAGSQNLSFDFQTTGKRVCFVESTVDILTPSITIKFLDSHDNTSDFTDIYRRKLYGTGTSWLPVAANLPPGTHQWVDTNVNLGEIWEYQIKRQNAWPYKGQLYDATGYTCGAVLTDKTDYQGQLILLVADNIVSQLPGKYKRLKKELTGEGWFVNEIIVAKARGWNSGDRIVAVKNKIIATFETAPKDDKPRILFIIGHVAMPRSGSTAVIAPDDHDQNKGARGCDAYYADLDGIFTDRATFDPGGLQTPLAKNRPNDFKWDQDFFPSDIEMAFGRIDFEDIRDYGLSEIQMIETYLDKLSHYKRVSTGYNMGQKTAFFLGHPNSNDGSYRSLPNISTAANVYENTSQRPHPQWVKENGPFKIYMQNKGIPKISDWDTHGMNATVFSSDQSYWGFNDVPQGSRIHDKIKKVFMAKDPHDREYGRIRALLASNTKCLVTLWTTTGVNTFYQACSGDPLGLAVKRIMNHNTLNNNIEKPPQEWDHKAFWNRTYFAYNGDPTLRLYQVQPPSKLSVLKHHNNATLAWKASPDKAVIGYHIYKSTTKFGIYNKLTHRPIPQLTYRDNTFQKKDNYMVRAIKIEESGCGKFLNPSIGIF